MTDDARLALRVTLLRITFGSNGQIPTEISKYAFKSLMCDFNLPERTNEDTIRVDENAALSMKSFFISFGKSLFFIFLFPFLK